MKVLPVQKLNLFYPNSMRKKVVIVDDEKAGVENLTLLFEEFCPNFELVTSFNDPNLLVDYLENNDYPDILFLDIQMPELSGFELLEKINNEVIDVVFVTAFAEHAIEAIDYKPFAYLLKPVDIDKLINVYKRICVDDKSNAIDTIQISAQEGVRLIKIVQILRLKADRSYCQILLDTKEEILVSKSLGQIMKGVNHPDLYRCHKSFVININAISSYLYRNGGAVLLNNEHEIPVSRARKDELLKIINL